MTDARSGYQPTPFANSLRAHMDEWCAEVGSRPLSWAKWTDGIYPDYRALAEKAVHADSVKLHEYAAHILSSQAFAFNLFLPFREGSRERLSERFSEIVGARLTIDRVRFEWVPPGGLPAPRPPPASARGEKARRPSYSCGIDLSHTQYPRSELGWSSHRFRHSVPAFCYTSSLNLKVKVLDFVKSGGALDSCISPECRYAVT